MKLFHEINFVIYYLTLQRGLIINSAPSSLNHSDDSRSKHHYFIHPVPSRFTNDSSVRKHFLWKKHTKPSETIPPSLRKEILRKLSSHQTRHFLNTDVPQTNNSFNNNGKRRKRSPFTNPFVFSDPNNEYQLYPSSNWFPNPYNRRQSSVSDRNERWNNKQRRRSSANMPSQFWVQPGAGSSSSFERKKIFDLNTPTYGTIDPKWSRQTNGMTLDRMNHINLEHKHATNHHVRASTKENSAKRSIRFENMNHGRNHHYHHHTHDEKEDRKYYADLRPYRVDNNTKVHTRGKNNFYNQYSNNYASRQGRNDDSYFENHQSSPQIDSYGIRWNDISNELRVESTSKNENPSSFKRRQASSEEYFDGHDNSLWHEHKKNTGKFAHLTIETAVFVDKDLYAHMKSNFPEDTHGEVSRIVLAMINAVQLLYNDPSLGHQVDFVLKRLEVLEDDPPGLLRPYDIDRFLTNFCKWQKTENPAADTDPLHWDHALILTGLDLYVIHESGKISNQVVGLAPVSGMCTKSSSCTVNEGRHFESVFVISHEIGHK